jgi:Carboxypeptidase regulatory-like domain
VQPGQAVSDLSLTLTDRPTELSGTLVDASGRPAAGYVVIVFSTDRTHWSIAPRRSSGVVRIGSNGTYRVTGLPPGEYHLAALIDADAQDAGDPSFLDQLVPVSLTITLSEGERKQQDLRVGG